MINNNIAEVLYIIYCFNKVVNLQRVINNSELTSQFWKHFQETTLLDSRWIIYNSLYYCYIDHESFHI